MRLTCMRGTLMHIFRRVQEKQIHKDSTGYKTMFNGNTLQILSSVQTQRSVLQPVCEVITAVL